MKLLLDQGLPRSAVTHLRNAGVDAVHVGEIGLATADDAIILQHGLQDDRCVVTLDADFHRLMALSGAILPSVIRIRIEGLKGNQLAALLVTVLQACGNELQQGALVSVTVAGIRLRKLPLTP